MERESETIPLCFICTLWVSVQAGPAFEPDMAPLAGFGLSIRDQRRTPNERPIEEQQNRFLTDTTKSIPRRKPRNLVADLQSV